MKYIKDFLNLRNSKAKSDDQFFKTKKETERWLNEMSVINFHIQKNLVVDVEQGISLIRKKLDYIPVQFGVVNGDFHCSYNQLTSLKGCPRIVKGGFSCANNKLTSLEFSPISVGYDYHCSNNQLTSLKGCPKTIESEFACSYNKLKTLEFGPELIKGDLYCDGNNLKDLNYFPRILGKIHVNKNPINQLLIFLNDYLEHYENAIKDQQLKKYIEYLNEYDVIKGNNIYLDRLKDVFYIMDMNDFDYDYLLDIKGYNIVS